MQISRQESERFPKKFKWMYEHLMFITHTAPTTLEVLAAILVMEKEDPTKLIELMKEMNNE